MKKVLVLGAGLVSGPLVRHLLERGTYSVVVATRTVSKAITLIDGNPRGTAVALDVTNEARVEELVREADLVISLLPYTHHVMVAGHCLSYGKNMVTTSYISDAMRGLGDRASERGIIILNECGLDPGIDHMSAMRIIHDVERRGGEIRSFSSCCGALPAHVSNNNPFGYKFSWSPRGVVLAGKNAASYLKDGAVVEIPGPELFDNYEFKTVPGVGVFENYPNRNSLPYSKLYGIGEAHTVYRGTLRFPGWCETLKKIAELGLLDETDRDGIKDRSYYRLVREIVGEEGTIHEAAARFLHIDPHCAIIKRLDWLGLFSHDLVSGSDRSLLDILATRMLDRMKMDDGDVDMCVLFHEFLAEFPDGTREHLTSTLLVHGIPGGDTAISRTVALPAAIAAEMILEGKITVKGVHLPIIPEVYRPILDKLESFGISFKERAEKVQ